MPYAEVLGGAFLYGEGVHAWWNRDNGRYMDNLWLYDANAHRWVNMYPGTDIPNLRAVELNEDGFETLSDGRPVPIAIAVHGYEMVTWDTHRQFLYVMPMGNGYFKSVAPAIDRFRSENAARYNERNASPWIFDPWNLRWHRVKTLTQSPPTGVGDVLVYLPSRRQSFYRNQQRVYFYDPETNRWRTANPGGPPPPFGIDPVSCYDSKRDRIYIGGGNYPIAGGDNALWIFDVASGDWIDPKPSGSSGGNHFGTNIAILNCDTVNDRVVLFRHSEKQLGVYVYDPERNAWAARPAPLPDGWPAHGVSNGFFNPAAGVHYIFRAKDSQDNGTMWVWRLAR